MMKNRMRRIALLNVADAIGADIDNGVEYLRHDPETHEDLTDKQAEAVEREMKRIIARLRERAGTRSIR